MEEGTTIIKLFLHISKEKQLKKIKERLEDPKKHWKFDASDLQEREYWDDYQEAYEDVFKESSIDKAPWYWIPANHQWYRNYLTLSIVVKTLESLDLSYPKLNTPHLTYRNSFLHVINPLDRSTSITAPEIEYVFTAQLRPQWHYSVKLSRVLLYLRCCFD